MASSSADISAACLTAAIFCAREMSNYEIANIALSIEPTDGIFYPEIVMFDHIRGRIRYKLGMPPPIAIAVFDYGGEVDTVFFNRRQGVTVAHSGTVIDVMLPFQPNREAACIPRAIRQLPRSYLIFLPAG